MLSQNILILLIIERDDSISQVRVCIYKELMSINAQIAQEKISLFSFTVQVNKICHMNEVSLKGVS